LERRDNEADVERAKRYRLRAEEVRSIAQDMKQEMTRTTLERVAREYEEMAAVLETRTVRENDWGGRENGMD
jgi:hypothetical protein